MIENDPDGCLGCNRDEIRALLESRSIDPDRFVEIARPRLECEDVICCNRCELAWLYQRPAPTVA